MTLQADVNFTLSATTTIIIIIIIIIIILIWLCQVRPDCGPHLIALTYSSTL
jgi:hypothetical protein